MSSVKEPRLTVDYTTKISSTSSISLSSAGNRYSSPSFLLFNVSFYEFFTLQHDSRTPYGCVNDSHVLPPGRGQPTRPGSLLDTWITCHCWNIFLDHKDDFSNVCVLQSLGVVNGVLLLL